MAKSTAFFEGQEAFIDETHNPYATGSIEWEEWERGWLEEMDSIENAVRKLDTIRGEL